MAIGNGEIWNRHKTGKVVPLWMTISTMLNENIVERYIISIYDITEQKISIDRINYLAHYDLLTDLPNRTLLMEKFDQAIQTAEKQSTVISVLFIDLDNFKNINDSYGHQIGDILLCEVASRLKTCVGHNNFVGRLSGDEFMALIMDPPNIKTVHRLAEKIVTTLTEPFMLSIGECVISASIGIANYPQDGIARFDLLKHADLAMYRAKETGRNQYFFYEEEMSTQAQERMRLQNDLRQALNTQQIAVFYQPIVDLLTGKPIGVEVLSRWSHQEMGMISPDKFIPLAEENPIIHHLGEYVLEIACHQMKRWLDKGYPLRFISINVSGKQIMQSNFYELLKRILSESKCPASCITLELTESFVMNESEGAVARLKALRSLGVGIAIDDFGTGYSSLSYLKRLPVTKLKLDKSFVSDIPNDINDTAITRAIIKLSEAVDLEVIAEGVETLEQESFLRREHCRMGQGYLYSKALPVEEIEAFFDKTM